MTTPGAALADPADQGPEAMYRGPCLADISEAEEEAAEDTLSSASTASFWSHERELYDPWWRATPPTAAAIRASSSTPPLYRGLVRTAPPTSPVRTRARRPKKFIPTGRSTTPPFHCYAPPRRRTRPYGKISQRCGNKSRGREPPSPSHRCLGDVGRRWRLPCRE